MPDCGRGFAPASPVHGSNGGIATGGATAPGVVTATAGTGETRETRETREKTGQRAGSGMLSTREASRMPVGQAPGRPIPGPKSREMARMAAKKIRPDGGGGAMGVPELWEMSVQA